MAKTKQQTLRWDEVVIGKLVVVSEATDTQVYRIAQRDMKNRTVHLVYDAGDREVSGGWIDYGVLMLPTDNQLDYNGLHFVFEQYRGRSKGDVDYLIKHAGSSALVGTWQRAARGYRLIDTHGNPVRIPNPRYDEISGAIRTYAAVCSLKDHFTECTARYLRFLSPNATKERADKIAADRLAYEAQCEEERRAERIREAGPALLAALQLVVDSGVTLSDEITDKVLAAIREATVTP